MTEEMHDFVDNQGFSIYEFGISQVYHHFGIGENYQKYLSFSWKTDSKIIYFMFTVLLFGLSSAPFILPRLCVVF